MTQKVDVLVCHGVENPIRVVSDLGIDSRIALGVTLYWSVADHAVLNGAHCLAIVYTDCLQRSAAITVTRVDFIYAAGTKLFVPDLLGPFVHLFTLFIRHQW